MLRPEHFGKKEAVSAWGWADVTESYRFHGFEGKEIRLDIYSDADEVEIRINGIVIDRAEVPETYIVQKNVIYEPGIIEVANYRDGKRMESSSLKTVGKASALRLTAARTDANDVQIVVVEAVDSHGERVPYDCSKVSVCTLENARVAGFGTGNPVSEENFTTDTCTLYEGRALLVLEKEDDEKECRVVVTGNDALRILTGELKIVV